MLAYTNISDLFYAPTPLEAFVYLTGFIMVLTLPSVLFGLADRWAARKAQTIRKPHQASEN